MIGSKKPLKILRPSCVKTTQGEGGIHISWRRPDWFWVVIYGFVAVASVTCLVYWEPDIFKGLWIGLFRIEQIGLAVAAPVSLWGALSALGNVNKVIVGKHHITRVTWPFCLIRRKTVVRTVTINKFYMDQRPHWGRQIFPLVAIVEGGRAVDLFISPHKEISRYLYQRLYLVIKEEKETRRKNRQQRRARAAAQGR